ncbi:MazG family protein [Gottschalkia acidurici 9a]|uniref:MazG family protein n=1 Tax=Gottschalkia acidurici (strain ATCC 7906 / DSM 604 / BCRC 14475 / CIP 104303 / KCTC 5404 / NCIMB 10678 / 9a) TaxID=1128398 RepID=K0B1M7_GOTA9|nr:nucleoside triphosphate pyrophosphohydrolase [Gottschalkia acidurici]AFS79374.1 MazG family protein [Gottschalkia acidurici 9a]
MRKIVIIGLGPGDIGSLTIEAVEKICDGNKVFLRTEKHPTIEYLKKKQIEYTSYDHVYDEEEDFDKVYELISKNLIQMSEKYGIINYCVPGHPLVAEKTVSLLIEKQEQGEIELEIIAGLSFIEPVILSVGSDPVDGLKIIDGLDILHQSVDINTDNLITQVYNRVRASELKLELIDIYGDEYEVYVIKSAGIKGQEIKVKVPLYEIDRIEWIDYLTSIYIPKMDKDKRVKYDMYNLMAIMEILRSKDGCSWDAEQTHTSLRPYVIEEAYEVVDAIDNDDIDGITEELGDLLLQIIFHSQIGKEEGYFTIMDVTTSICEKLIRRHPHVFTDFRAKSSQEVVYDWNDIKAKEKNMTTYTERIKSIPKGLPALMKSYKVQKRAADVGFDWEDVSGALEKLEEELNEVKEELNTSNKERLENEIGDLIFSIVNVCRFVNVNPENAVNKTINKFIKRFEFIETESINQGKDIKNMTLEEMDKLWKQAKENEN